MKKFLIVVDMQRDFVDGSLGSPEAQAIVPNVVRKIEGFDGEIIATFDTHSDLCNKDKIRSNIKWHKVT